jgi:hypothetical protein
VILAGAVTHTTVVNQGPLSGIWGQILAGIVVLFIGGVGTLMLRKFNTVLKNIDQTVEKVDNVYGAVAGRKPTEMEPNPPPGLLSLTTGHTKAIQETALEVKKMAQHQLDQNGKVATIERQVATIAPMVRALLTDIHPDDGTTMRDQVDSIVQEQKRVADVLVESPPATKADVEAAADRNAATSTANKDAIVVQITHETEGQ